MENVICNKKINEFVRKFNKEERNKVIELLCLVGIRYVKDKGKAYKEITLKELEDMGKNENKESIQKRRGKSDKGGLIKKSNNVNMYIKDNNTKKKKVNNTRNIKHNNNNIDISNNNQTEHTSIISPLPAYLSPSYTYQTNNTNTLQYTQCHYHQCHYHCPCMYHTHTHHHTSINNYV